MAEHLGLHTVGDLLHHYPRRYEERGPAHPPRRPADGRARHGGRPGRRRPPAHLHHGGPRGKGQRLEVTITDGSGRLQLVFFGHGVHKPHKDLLPGTRAHVRRQGLRLQPQAPAGPPGLRAAARRRRPTGTRSTPGPAPAHPDLPGHRQAGVLEDRQGRQTPCCPAPRRPWTRCRPPCARAAGLVPLPEALLKIHRPHTKADIEDARAAPQVGRGLRPPGRPGPPPPRRRPTPGRRPPPRPRRPARLPSTPSCPSPSPRASRRSPRRSSTTWPPSHPMHRLLQGEVGSRQDDGRPARHARRRRRRRSGRDARAHRGARPAAPPVDHRDDGRAGRGRHARRRRAGHQGGAAHRLDGRRRAAARRCSTWSPARPGS